MASRIIAERYAHLHVCIPRILYAYWEWPITMNYLLKSLCEPCTRLIRGHHLQLEVQLYIIFMVH